MSAFTEFVLVAIALYLWESTLWLPLRGVILRRRWPGGGWKAIQPGGVIATRKLGMIALLPFVPDAGLAPCQAPPLLAGDDDDFLIESAPGVFRRIAAPTWEDLKVMDHDLSTGNTKVRITSARCVEVLSRARARGATPGEAVRQAWRLALSPPRAAREWRRWQLVSGPLLLSGPLLTVGAFVGLPLAYFQGDHLTLLALALTLWCIMAFTAAHLFWLGKRVYPAAGPALRMDAWLAMLVPFHAMRALEIAGVHAMATTHPVALILGGGDFDNPWLGNFMRKILHPLPDRTCCASALKSHVAEAFNRSGKRLEDFDSPPARSDESASTRYCPRCHGLYVKPVSNCPDCAGIALREFTTDS